MFSTQKIKSDVNVFQCWEENRLEYPHLYVVAYVMLLIKPSSTECERVFSKCARFINKFRCAMVPDTLDRLVFLAGNSYFFERASKNLGQNWKPTNIGIRNLERKRKMDNLSEMDIDFEKEIFNSE